MAVRYKMKKKYKIFFTIILLLVIALISYFYITYRLSNKYKFKELGYNQTEVNFLLKYDVSFQNKLLTYGKDDELLDILKEKYFIPGNLDSYISFKKKNRIDENVTLDEIIAKVNIGRNKEYYEKTIKTDISKGNLKLVNKYNYLESSFVPKGVAKADLTYAYDDVLVSSESYGAVKKMIDAAKEDGVKLILTSGYRSFDSQKAVYEDFDKNYGEEYADNYAARAGYSEHQTGLGYDIVSPGVLGENFDKTDGFKWLEKNAQDYGFILRYPKGKEDYTGFKYESWHYRYVGENIAKTIKKEKITFDEYYAYYINYKKQVN